MSLNKVLYHYTTSENALKILSSGIIVPSIPYTYLSINLLGGFDVQSPTGPKGAGWVSGRSQFPNIFLTDTPPQQIYTESFGSNHNKDYAFWMTIGDILNQNLSVYQNPSYEYPNIYNILCPNPNVKLDIDPEKIINLKF